MKVVGPLHKSDVGGVVLDEDRRAGVSEVYERLIEIRDSKAVLIQPMFSGTELFAGLKAEPGFGHLILCGMGGIFVEALKDVGAGLAPLSADEARGMIRGLRAYPVIEGVRGKEGVNQDVFRDILLCLSGLAGVAPEIAELDLNPLIASGGKITAVDARIRIQCSHPPG
jgi:acetyltransferase